MVSSYAYCVVWTFCTQSQTTSGVIIVRPDHPRPDPYEQWWQVLTTQTGSVRHPLWPFLVSALQSMEETYRNTAECQAHINQVESLTRFNPWTQGRPPSSPPPMELDDLSRLSRNIGSVMISLEDCMRQVKLLQHTTESYQRSGFVDEGVNITPAVHILQQQMDSWGIRLQYLSERAKNQVSVVSHSDHQQEGDSQCKKLIDCKRSSISCHAMMPHPALQLLGPPKRTVHP